MMKPSDSIRGTTGALKLSIVIPVYNEGESILLLLQALKSRINTPHHVCIAYDFEEDNTVPVIRQWQRQQPNVFLVRNRLGPGPANAMRAGFGQVAGGYVVVLMADSSDRIEDIDKMYALAEQGYDIVAGSRYMKEGQQIGGPWLKTLLSRAAGLSLHWLTGIPTRDVTNSFKLYRQELLAALTLESRRGFELATEITAKAFVLGYQITEIPTTWHDRTLGTSRFRVFRWLPHYLRWYIYALLHRNRLWWIR